MSVFNKVVVFEVEVAILLIQLSPNHAKDQIEKTNKFREKTVDLKQKDFNPDFVSCSLTYKEKKGYFS